jgi:hypothetical protein
MEGAGFLGLADTHKTSVELIDALEELENAAIQKKRIYPKAKYTICQTFSND